MATIKRTFNYFGEKVTVELTVSTNEEHNRYIAERMRNEDDEALIRFRAAEFDRRVSSISKPKEEIFDAAKSSVMFQLFENFAVDPKN